MDQKTDCHELDLVDKFTFYLFDPTGFLSVSKKGSANVSLMLSGTLEVCCNKLSKTKEILFEN